MRFIFLYFILIRLHFFILPNGLDVMTPFEEFGRPSKETKQLRLMSAQEFNNMHRNHGPSISFPLTYY